MLRQSAGDMHKTPCGGTFAPFPYGTGAGAGFLRMALLMIFAAHPNLSKGSGTESGSSSLQVTR